MSGRASLPWLAVLMCRAACRYWRNDALVEFCKQQVFLLQPITPATLSVRTAQKCCLESACYRLSAATGDIRGPNSILSSTHSMRDCICRPAEAGRTLAQNIVLTAYSPLGSPDSLSMMGRDKSVPVLLEDKQLNSIAKKLGKNAGQVRVSVHQLPAVDA